MTNKKILYLSELSLLIAIIIIMNFTPLGYLRVGIVEMSFIPVCVAIGAALLGPAAGLILGSVFGVSSLMTAPTTIFAAALTAAPLKTAIVCLVPRMLMGYSVGWIAVFLKKYDKSGIAAYAATGLFAALLNTVLFISAILLLLTPLVEPVLSGLGLLSSKTVAAFFIGVGVTNGIPEMLASAVLTAVICKALNFKRRRV